MNSISIVLKIMAPLFVAVGALHLVLGLNAEILLGAELKSATITNPALDSQNRFYGVAFSVYGVLFYVCSRDISKYTTIIYSLLWVFFAAGISRFVSIALYGFPPTLMGILLIIEITFPLVLIMWLHRASSES